MRLLSILVRQRAGDSIWLIPVAVILALALLALGSVALDASRPGLHEAPFLFPGGVESSRQFLATIATAMLGAGSVVFTVTVIVVQQASTQFSPRVLRNYLRDPIAKATLGIFAGTFIYALIVLGSTTVVGDDDEAHRALGVTGALVLSLASTILLVIYIHHTVQSVRVVTIVQSVADETHAAIDRLFPDLAGEEERTDVTLPGATFRVVSDQEGSIVAIDTAEVLHYARTEDVFVEVLAQVGDYVPRGAPLAAIHGEPSSRDAASACINEAVLLGKERTLEQDVAFGFRQLVDIAVRALSPSTSDPATAVQVMDRIQGLLRHLGERDIPSPRYLEDDRQVRVVLPRPAWSGFVHLAFDEIIEHGRGASQLRERFHQVCDDLEDGLPASRKPDIVRHRAELERLARDVVIAHAS